MNALLRNRQAVSLHDAKKPGVYSYQRLKKAFTLSELLITLAVLSIVTMLALPSFTNMLMNSRQTVNSDALVNALNYARSTALNQEMSVQVCPLSSSGSSSCGSTWNAGGIVVSQPTSGTSTLLQSRAFASTDPTLTATVSSVTFDSHGIATTQSNFKLCDTRGGQFAHSVEVLATGYIQSSSTAGQAVWDNSALACP